QLRARPQTRLYAGEDRPATVEPLHRGYVFREPVALFSVEDGMIRRVPYTPAMFDFGRLIVPPTLPDMGHSGLRLFGDVIDGKDREVAVFQGATFFKALARGQNYGVIARALAIKVAEARGEEFPFFRAFWLERPAPSATGIVVHGLIDSESATGVMRSTIRPGDATIIDSEITLFARQIIDHFGIGALSATFLFGPGDRRGADDVRPAVYDAGGLQLLRGNGEWVWRPFRNPSTLQMSVFADENPRGFGFLQRDRDFALFQDDDARLERRPSLWIEPIGDWGAGAFQLVEIPSDSDVNDNIIGYWRPRQPLAAGSEITFAYRQFWTWQPPERPSVATVTQTRVGRGTAVRRRRFIVDFHGETLGDSRTGMEMSVALSSSAGTISGLRVLPYAERNTCRVMFELDPASETLCELRMQLQARNQAISETWLYRWTAQ
ncbi:MAG: glucan biosynthesis protein, partial [Beijerinckiaceae bacterium]